MRRPGCLKHSDSCPARSGNVRSWPGAPVPNLIDVKDSDSRRWGHRYDRLWLKRVKEAAFCESPSELLGHVTAINTEATFRLNQRNVSCRSFPAFADNMPKVAWPEADLSQQG